MNIFYLSDDPQICAEQHCDKHVVKMCIEYAQLLSTAHRVLDGEEYTVIQNGRRVTLITQVINGYERVILTTGGCVIYYIVYSKSTHIGMVSSMQWVGE